MTSARSEHGFLRIGARAPTGAGGAVGALVCLVALSGCPQRTTEAPHPPPAIYVDPPRPPPANDPYRTRGSGAEPCPSCGPAGEAEPDGQTFTPSDPSAPSEQPGFKDTLEGIPSEAPAGGRDGVAGAGTCEEGRRQVGESWKVKCNTCSCEPSGEVICTLMACINADGV